MKMTEAFPTKYISAPDLKGKEPTVAINKVVMEDIGSGDHKPVVYFQGKEKGLVLNKTNANMIAMLYGDESDAWTGGEVTLFVIKTEFQGKVVDGIRVKMAVQQINPEPAQPAPAAAPAADEPIDEIPF